MGSIVTIDPVTRIDGHLKVDLEISEGKVIDAWSSGQMYRGIEEITTGLDATEAWIYAQRICGACTSVNAIASVRAVENALNLDIPLNAQMIRNMIIAANAIHDHLVHFYLQSVLDWIDITKVKDANPKKAAAFAQSLSPWYRNSVHEMQSVQDKIGAILSSGQQSVFSNGYWGHSEMSLSPDNCLIILTHYFQAMAFQRKINDCVGLLGGKTPHIQNLAVGGVMNAINLDDETALNMTRLQKIKVFLDEVYAFVDQVYLIDTCLLGAKYLDWAQLGAGVMNYLAVPEYPTNSSGSAFNMPGGVIFDSKIGVVTKIKHHKDPYLIDNISETVAHSWYEGQWQKHPWKETTDPEYSGYYPSEKYSWVKSPRFMGKSMQTGPLAQVLTSFALGDDQTQIYINKAIELIKSVSGKKISLANLHSTIGRHVARAVQAAVVNQRIMEYWTILMNNISEGDMDYFNKPIFPQGELKGVGCHESPNGFVSHWLTIHDGKIQNFQAITASTWNMGPKDMAGKRGPLEESLIGNPIQDIDRPLEALRTIHSFHPCLACAAH